MSLPMSNAKAVPVVWNDFSFAGPLKDRHYDRMKKKVLHDSAAFLWFPGSTEQLRSVAERKAPTGSRSVFQRGKGKSPP